MRVAGGAIGPDEVLLWTGERELTRLSRDGRRSSWTVPMPHLTSHIGPEGVRLVDQLGTLHRYSLGGAHEGATELVFEPDGPLIAAALAADLDRWVIVEDPPRTSFGDRMSHALVVEDGGLVSWNTLLPDGYAETDAALSRDGSVLMVCFDTFYYFTGYGSGGPGPGSGAYLRDIDGTERFRQHDRERFEGAAMSPDGGALVWWERWSERLDVRVEDARGEWSLEGFGTGVHIAFDDARVAAIYEQPSQLVVAELATHRQAQLELPERFTDLVFCGEHVVLLHAELTPWWIPIATLRFEAAD